MNAAERAMSTTGNFLNLMATHTPTLTRVSDETGLCRFFNDAWTSFTGHAFNGESAPAWLQCVHRDDRTVLAATYLQAIASQTDVEVQFRLLRRDGTYCWMLDRAAPWRRGDGSFGGFVCASTDITALKQTDHAQDSEPWPGMWLRVSNDGHLRAASDDVFRVFDVSAEHMLDRPLRDTGLPTSLLDALQRLLPMNADAAAPKTGTRIGEIEFELQDGGQRRHVMASAIADAPGSVSIVTHEVTQHVATRALLRDSQQREEQSRHKADAASRARDQFLSVVSHELRSPLNGIQSWAHVLESQIDTGKPIVYRALTGIKTGVAQQVALIEALLDATQIVNGQLSLIPHTYALVAVIRGAIENLRVEAEQKNVDIRFAEENADIAMHGDGERIQQIIRHLLSNAVKFSGDGARVDVSVAVESSTAPSDLSEGERSHSGRMAVVTVSDNGVGISPGFVPMLFEPFRQVDSSQTRRSAGLGLGLAVSRRIARLHGGDLVCESKGVGHGSTFRVSLPLPG